MGPPQVVPFDMGQSSEDISDPNKPGLETTTGVTSTGKMTNVPIYSQKGVPNERKGSTQGLGDPYGESVLVASAEIERERGTEVITIADDAGPDELSNGMFQMAVRHRYGQKTRSSFVGLGRGPMLIGRRNSNPSSTESGASVVKQSSFSTSILMKRITVWSGFPTHWRQEQVMAVMRRFGRVKNIAKRGKEYVMEYNEFESCTHAITAMNGLVLKRSTVGMDVKFADDRAAALLGDDEDSNLVTDRQAIYNTLQPLYQAFYCFGAPNLEWFEHKSVWVRLGSRLYCVTLVLMSCLCGGHLLFYVAPLDYAEGKIVRFVTTMILFLFFLNTTLSLMLVIPSFLMPMSDHSLFRLAELCLKKDDLPYLKKCIHKVIQHGFIGIVVFWVATGIITYTYYFADDQHSGVGWTVLMCITSFFEWGHGFVAVARSRLYSKIGEIGTEHLMRCILEGQEPFAKIKHKYFSMTHEISRMATRESVYFHFSLLILIFDTIGVSAMVLVVGMESSGENSIDWAEVSRLYSIGLFMVVLNFIWWRRIFTQIILINEGFREVLFTIRSLHNTIPYDSATWSDIQQFFGIASNTEKRLIRGFHLFGQPLDRNLINKLYRLIGYIFGAIAFQVAIKAALTE